MQIVLIVRMDMVMAMVRRPPERSPLHRGTADGGKNKLDHAPRLEGAMREIAMIPTGERENTQGIESECNREPDPAETDPEYPDARDMHQDERYGTNPINAIFSVRRSGPLFHRRAEPKLGVIDDFLGAG